MPRPPQRFQFSSSDWPKIGKSFLLGLSGVIAAFLIDFSTETDFGQYDTIIAALVPVLVNAASKWIRDHSGDIDTPPPPSP